MHVLGDQLCTSSACPPQLVPTIQLPLMTATINCHAHKVPTVPVVIICEECALRTQVASVQSDHLNQLACLALLAISARAESRTRCHVQQCLATTALLVHRQLKV